MIRRVNSIWSERLADLPALGLPDRQHNQVSSHLDRRTPGREMTVVFNSLAVHNSLQGITR
jgi:hypothetical protein